MTNLFGDYADDIPDAPDDPFGLPDGTYKGAIINVEHRSGKKKDENETPWAGVAVTLSAKDDERTHQHYMPLPMGHDKPEVRTRKLSTIKKFLQGCEIPQSRMNKVDAEDLIDLEVVYTISTSKSGFRNLQIQLAKGSGVKLSSSDDMDFVNAGKSSDPVSDEDFGL